MTGTPGSSGVWPPIAPDGWTRQPVKRLASVTLGKMLQPIDTGEDQLRPYLRAANVQPDGLLAAGDLKEMWFSPAQFAELSVRAGDVVVVEGGQGGFGRAAYVDRDLVDVGFQNSINRVRPFPGCDGRYLAYSLIAARSTGFIHAYANVVSMPHFTAEKLASFPILAPPSGQQRAIADYLDRETAKIDALIAKQEELIQSLVGRWHHVVLHHVGISANPLSGSAASGYVSVGRHFSVVLGKMLDAGKAQREQDVELPYLRAANIQDCGLDLRTVNRMPYSLSEARALDLRRGDLLVVEGGAVGTCVVLDEDMSAWSFQKTVNRVRALGEHSTRYLAHVLRAYRDAGVIDIVCNKSTIPHLTAEKLRALRIPLLPIEEQGRIADELDRRAAASDRLIEHSRLLIRLSRERRAALITAAVTGQIDVRGQVA